MKRKKSLNDVYMREAIKKNIVVKKNENLNAYITFKEVIAVSQECKIFINGEKKIILDNNYTIMEYSPINDFYNVRIFIDSNDNIILYYFDIILENYFDGNSVFYDDLYLDVTLYTKFSTGNEEYISLDDEAELINALNEKQISKKEYEFAYNIAIRIMNEIKAKKNKFVNRGLIDYYECK